MKFLKESPAIRSMARLPAHATVACALAGTPLLSLADTPAGDTVLAPVKVTGQRTDNPDYGSSLTSVGKMPMAQRDIPQSTTVITRQLMDDQQDTTLREALRNVSGLTINAGEGGASGDSFTLRGYSVATDLFLDGVRDAGQYSRDTFNYERVDILRGATSMLYGRGSTGGIINQVSKSAHLGDRSDLELGIGTDDYYRATVDLNRQTGDDSAVRLNLMGQKSDSWRDGPEFNRFGVAPTFRWGIGTPTEVELSYFYLKENNVPDYGVPYNPVTGEPIDKPGTFYGLPDYDYEDTTTQIATATVKHRFSPTASIKNTLRYGQYERDLMPSAPRLNAAGVPTDNTPMKLEHKTRLGELDIWSNQTDFNFKLFTGPLTHNILTGAEIGRETSDVTSWRHKSGANLTGGTVGNPDHNLRPADPTPVITGQTEFTVDTLAVYLQDMIEFTPEWKLLLGARWDRFDGDYTRMTVSGTTPVTEHYTRKDSVLSYRIGPLWQPSESQSYYAAFGTSFNPSGEAYSLDPKGSNTPPEKNRNIEIGAKWDLLDGDLLLRTAVFRTEKTNERNTDTDASPDEYLLSGARRTDGVEFEIAGRLTANWQVFAGAAIMDPKITRAVGNDAFKVGQRPENAPKHTYNLWTTYRFAEGWKIGGGLNAVGRRWTQPTLNGANSLPGYLRWDGMIGYETRSWEAQLNVYNLTDTTWYEGLYRGHAVPGTARSARLTVNFKL